MEERVLTYMLDGIPVWSNWLLLLHNKLDLTRETLHLHARLRTRSELSNLERGKLDPLDCLRPEKLWNEQSPSHWIQNFVNHSVSRAIVSSLYQQLSVSNKHIGEI